MSIRLASSKMADQNAAESDCGRQIGDQVKPYMRYVIRSPEILGNAVSAIAQVPTDGSVTVEIKGTKDERRIAQNSTYWMWLSDISKHTGHSVDELHDGCRKTYLTKIYLEQPHGRLQEAWSRTYADLSALIADMPPDEAIPIIDRVKLLVSTTWASVDQFTDYLNRIEQYCISLNIKLRHPDDIKYPV
jgi:hypothetical protein